MSTKKLASRVFAWLRNICRDRAVSASAFRLAFEISQHFDNAGECFPGQKSLADATGSDVRTVRRLIEELVEAGHLTVKPHASKFRTSVYRMTDNRTKMPGLERTDLSGQSGQKCPVTNETERTFLAGEPDTDVRSERTFLAVRADKNVRESTSEPLSIHFREPLQRESEASPADLFKEKATAADSELKIRPETSRPRRRAARTIPDDFVPDIAFAERLGLNPEIEAAKFRDHALTNDRRCSDWAAAFRNWCRRGAEMAKSNSNGSARTIDEFGNPIGHPRRARGRTHLEIAQEMNRRDAWGGNDE